MSIGCKRGRVGNLAKDMRSMLQLGHAALAKLGRDRLGGGSESAAGLESSVRCTQGF